MGTPSVGLVALLGTVLGVGVGVAAGSGLCGTFTGTAHLPG
ncbi:hypothetical protein [Curtobacterium sp. L1-20]